MLRIAICDDKRDQIERVKSFAEHYFANREAREFALREYDNSLLFLEEIDKSGGFDIVLLDICMPGILGTEVASEICRRKDNTEIVFLTTSDEFAVEAFALKAAHYIVKPFTQELFNEAMDRVMDRFAKKQESKIILKLRNEGIQTIDVDEIMYVESFAHVQTLYLKNGEEIEVRHSLSGLMTELEALSRDQFVTPYKGYIVNQKSIKRIEPNQIVLHNEKSVPLARGGFRAMKERHFDFMFGGDVQ